MFESPVIDDRIKEIAPGFRAMSIHVDATNAGEGSLHTGLLTDACDYVLRGGPAWADAHLTSWADAYTRFGAKPNRTPCSAQALRKRVLKDGMIPSINPIVDLYNAVSLKYAIPVGGENYDCLCRASASYRGRRTRTIRNSHERRSSDRESPSWRGHLARRCGRHMPALELAAGHAHPTGRNRSSHVVCVRKP